MMWDPDFDPYEELMIARHNIGELVKGITHQSELLKDLANQHQQLIDLNKTLIRRIDRLEQEVQSLKQT